jgi:N-acyl-phosphatidylethanolamine-hydrolysing phospholipase D
MSMSPPFTHRQSFTRTSDRGIFKFGMADSPVRIVELTSPGSSDASVSASGFQAPLPPAEAMGPDGTIRSIAPSGGIPWSIAPFFASPRSDDGTLANPWGIEVDPSAADTLKYRATRSQWAMDKKILGFEPELEEHPRARWRQAVKGARISWLGHSSLLVDVDNVTVLIDPVLGSAGGSKRKAPQQWSLRSLPKIDAVLISQGGADHFDGKTIKKLREQFGDELVLIVPTGMAVRLPKSCRENVIELGWWQATPVRGVEMCFLPAQHWDRRGTFDADDALWGGFIIRGSRTVYYSGDTGWFGGFKAIARVFPSIDVAALPIGGWAPRWFLEKGHLTPGQAVKAFRALGARQFLAVHHGTFDLTDEPLDEGHRELITAVEKANLDIDQFVVLEHGASMSFAE